MKLTVGLLISVILLFNWSTIAQSREIIKISGTSSGVSTRYIGAVEGNVNFNIADLQDLGLNTYRIYGGMARWEARDDDAVYGWPSIAAIKANPNIINWAWWDDAMTNPPNGSDYWWSGTPGTTWQGNARTIFGTLKQAGIRPVLTLRNTDSSHNPPWARQLNPPKTEADWNEWWEHVFATVYWLNVRNDYRVDDFEIHNEPDNPEQGWVGSQAKYLELVKVSKDAIDSVYKTYLPDRTYHVHAPVTIGNSRWPLYALQQIPTYFDSINIHNYATDISSYTQQVHNWINSTIHAKAPLWLGEWGTYQDRYNNLPFAINLIKNAIRGSYSNSYIYGSHIFSLYDWGQKGGIQGLIGAKGERRTSYYALRMAIRALQGGRATFLASTNNVNLTAIATKASSGNIYLLATNSGTESQAANVDLSALFTHGIGTVWELSAKRMDEIVAHLALTSSHINFNVPENGAVLFELVESVNQVLK